MTAHEASTEQREDSKPSAEQIDLIRRILAPHIHRARAERAEQQSIG
ncbi:MULTISPECIES: hypothetical protein [Streptomyces violaceusniger group]|uniref:Uncharacterized protein n=1 Tax=Streptomyces malaysiensis subsp. samsunensis TaxID=459658 RepID=A0A9X2LUR8_STRMQ|nr:MULTISPECIES: hypothetical protein [Streptomyces]MCQ8829836.1 hypothetical protein [Streptomyces samsunensis]